MTRGPNKAIHFPDGVTVIGLERRDGTVLPCFIDTEDYEQVRQYRWSVHGQSQYTFYAYSWNGKGMMHRLFVPDAEIVDHKDGNGLNNRRGNIRAVSHAENMRNRRNQRNSLTSKYRGVHLATSGKYISKIKVNGKQRYLGCFKNEEEAALAYDAVARQLHGDFARLNFPVTQKAA